MRQRAIFIGVALAVLGAMTSLARTPNNLSLPSGVGGAESREFNQPQRITEGSYDSPVRGPNAPPDAEVDGNAAAQREASDGYFRGWINGIYVWPDPLDLWPGFVPDASSSPNPPCPGRARIVPPEELEASPLSIYIKTPTTLPPGAVESETAYGEACGSEIVLLSRQFQLQPYGSGVGLVFRVGTRAARFSASVSRIHPMEINGHQAVFVSPLTERGFGGSAIFVLTKDGVLQVGGTDVRPAELLRIARETP